MRADRGQPIVMTWPAAAGAALYRVIVRDATTGEIVLRREVEGFSTAIDRRRLHPEHRYEWRVQGLSWRFGEWEDVLPYLRLLAPPASGAGIVELSWPAGEGPHRVLVRDETAQRTILKDAVLGSAYPLARELLAPGHDHTFAIQAWRDGGWTTMHDHRPLPAGEARVEVPAEPADDDAREWPAAPGVGSPSAPPGDRYTAAWGEARARELYESVLEPAAIDWAGAVVLDLGCHWGYLLEHLLEQRGIREGHGVDVEAHWLRMADGSDPAAVPGLHLHQGRLGEIPALEDVRLDVALIADTMSHIAPTELHRALAWVHEHLAPTGRLAVHTRAGDGTANPSSASTHLAQLERAGFEPEAVQRHGDAAALTAWLRPRAVDVAPR